MTLIWFWLTLAPTPKRRQKSVNYTKKPDVWYTMAAMNIADAGYFSADRSVKDYASEVEWQQMITYNHPGLHGFYFLIEVTPIWELEYNK